MPRYAMDLLSTRAVLLASFLSCLTVAYLGTTDASSFESGKTRNAQKSNDCSSNAGLALLFDWESILKPCKYNQSWQSAAEREKNERMRTNVSYTQMIAKDIRFDELPSTIVIQTYTDGGRRKKVGGDSWRATLTGTSQQMANVYDNMDGTYQVKFRIHENGKYKLEMVLELSMCDGLRDPPLRWFELGDMQGHFQSPFILGPNNDYILERKVIDTFEVKDVKKAKCIEREKCLFAVHSGKGLKGWVKKEIDSKNNNEFWKTKYKDRCNLVWDSFAAWDSRNVECAYSEEGSRKLSTVKDDKSFDKLWVYGDSLSYRWWGSPFGIDICKRHFKYCNNTFTYTYAKREFSTSHISFGFSFNRSLFFNPIEIAFDDAHMQSERSVLLINFGIHLILSLNFTELKDTVDKFAELIQVKRSSKRALPRIVWRTTTSTFPEIKDLPNRLSARFLTNHRIQLFNAYANSKLCSVGVDIFDVYAETSAYQNACLDGLHFSHEAFTHANREFKFYLEECF